MACDGIWLNHEGICQLEKQVIEMVIPLKSVNNDDGEGVRKKHHLKFHNNDSFKNLYWKYK